MPKPCNFFFQNNNKTQVFTIIKPNIIKKSEHQQYGHCFINYIPIPYASWFTY